MRSNKRLFVLLSIFILAFISLIIFAYRSGKFCIKGFTQTSQVCFRDSLSIPLTITGHTYEASEGSCNSDAQCKSMIFACGIYSPCTNDPEKYQNSISVCFQSLNHPAIEGYTCGCIQNECGWKK